MKQEIKIGNPEMLKIWTNYTETKKTNKQRAEMQAVKTAKPFLNLCLRNFKVRREYWEEFYSFLLIDFFRALDTYKPETNVKIFGWVWRLCSQSAWRFIRDKQKSIEKENNTFSLEDYQEEIDDVTPESIYIQNEKTEKIYNDVQKYLYSVLRNPIEIEVFLRMNGLCGYKLCKEPETIANEMNLSVKTVEQIITRNNNDSASFRKWMKENKYTTIDFEILNQYKKYANSKRKK